ncbi:MAG: dimethyl sulfoxide reductase anchor subunit [Burkholderiales bacterium]|nr:dimethyl sulfoxide reductase anchor subunit [Burkholderiales bacterium]
MHPAFSVIFLTTLIGAGQGLFLALYTVELYSLFDLLPEQESRTFYAPGAAIALGLLALGLLASFFHLGRPERGWRAAARWRTSWLSREVIVLPAFMAAVAAYWLVHWAGWREPRFAPAAGLEVTPSAAIGAAATVLAFALYLCTGMIYACIRFLQEWASPLTVINYLLLGGASGFTLATAFAGYSAPALVPFLGGWAAVLTGIALVTRAASLVRNARLRPKSTLQTAIGVKHPRIVQTAQGFMGGSFNTREFFHGRTRAFVRAIKWTFLVLVFPVPVALLGAGIAAGSAALLALAFAAQYVGLLAERWFFFAQANHPQNLYYQAIA